MGGLERAKSTLMYYKMAPKRVSLCNVVKVPNYVQYGLSIFDGRDAIFRISTMKPKIF